MTRQNGPQTRDPDRGLRVAPSRTGLRIMFPARGAFLDVLKELEARLGDGTVVRGRAVTVDVGGRDLEVPQLRQIETLLVERMGVALLQVVQGQRAERVDEPAAAKAVEAPRATVRAGRRMRRGSVAPRRPRVPDDGLSLDMAPTLLVRRTLRSGQRVRFNGNVVVLGDVNAGAEIVAAGDIVVMGTLRGVCHAGASGDPEAQVVALRLQPVQLRVGPVIGRAPDGRVQRSSAGPEVARVQDGVLVIERYAAQGGELP